MGILKTLFSHLDETTLLTVITLGLCFPNFSGQENYSESFFKVGLNILIRNNGVRPRSLNITNTSADSETDAQRPKFTRQGCASHRAI